MDATDADSEQPNPYAPSELFEPAQQRNLQLLPVPVHARGRITVEDRQLGLQLAAWVTGPDWRTFLTRTGIIVAGLSLSRDPAVIGFALAIASLPLGMKLLRTRWARVSARRGAQNDSLVERMIGDEGVITMLGEPYFIPWSAYYTGRISPELIVLIQGKFDAYQVFPRRHFASEGEWAAFETAVRKYVRSVR